MKTNEEIDLHWDINDPVALAKAKREVDETRAYLEGCVQVTIDLLSFCMLSAPAVEKVRAALAEYDAEHGAPRAQTRND